MSLMNKIFPTEKQYVVRTTRKGEFVGEVVVHSVEAALKFLPPLHENELRNLTERGWLPKQVGMDTISITEQEVPTPPMKLYEARLRHDDPEMQEYHQDRHDSRKSREVEKEQMAGAPYAVGWSAQSLEWYGDDHPGSGRGRYKPKGDSGRIAYINVPDYRTAEKLANGIEEKQRNGDLDPHLNAKHGDDHFLSHYHGSYIKSMKDLDEYDKIHLKYDNPEDYSQHGAQ